ncbi:MAG: hypothetical protein IPJ18_13875 [Betaproteobacteria bacterium]|jgi:hypothetical protein|nr:hypothetical protein [Betaproteobacteria bacterium]
MRILTLLALAASLLGGCGGGSSTGGSADTTALSHSFFSACTAKGNETDAMASFGKYTVTTNVWNPSAAEFFSECIRARLDNATGLISADLTWNVQGSNNQVLAYPNFAYGWRVGTNQGSTTKKLPMTLDKLDDIHASGKVETTCAPGVDCVMNTAFDLLFSNTAKPDTWPPTGEVMVWVQATCKHCNAGKLVEVVSIDGVKFEVYKGEVTPPTGTASWTYVAYVAESTVTQFSFNMKNFVADSLKRGYLKPSDYLAVVELGTEVTSGQGSTKLSGYSIR